MIIENPQDLRVDRKIISNFVRNGVVADTNVLLILFITKYIHDCDENKEYLYDKINITPQEVSCLNTVLSNFKISKLIITPHIFSEFINRIRRDLKQDYKKINENCCNNLKEFFEVYVEKNYLINHEKFLDFGNDISLIFATEKQVKNHKIAMVISFDGTFLKVFILLPPLEETNLQKYLLSC